MRRIFLLAFALGLTLDATMFHGRYSAVMLQGAHTITHSVTDQNWSSMLVRCDGCG